MSGRKIIRLNDATSHGGKVVSVASHKLTIDGVPVARVGDECSCPIPDHSNCKIVEGDPNHTVDGVAVAYEGHGVSCGAKLIAGSGRLTKG